MKDLDLRVVRRLQRRFNDEFALLIDWKSFSIDRMVAAVAKRVGATIRLHAFHWEAYGYSGLTLGWTDRSEHQFLVLYEQAASDEHALAIILHELMHILLGHCSTERTSIELRSLLIDLGLLPSTAYPAIQPRLLYPRVDQHIVDKDISMEIEAEVGALWALTQVRDAGALPPAGNAFTHEQVAITTLLGMTELG